MKKHIMILSIFIAISFLLSSNYIHAETQGLPENLAQISEQGSTKMFYQEDKDKIEIYSCNIIRVNKTEVYPDEEEKRTENEKDKNTADTDDNSDDIFTSNVIEDIEKKYFREVDETDEDKDNEITSTGSGSETENQLGHGCDSSWFCTKWSDCFDNMTHCNNIAQEKDCNYNELYNMLSPCVSKINHSNMDNMTSESKLEEERAKFPLSLGLGLGAIPLISMFVLDRYMRYKKQKSKKEEEDRKIEEIKKKYADK